jgi:hypothetical protein
MRFRNSLPTTIRQFLNVHEFATLTLVAGLLLALICIDGVGRKLDHSFPGLYRNLASLSIAISEISYQTHGFVGLAQVDDVLGALKAGDPNKERVLELSHNPDAFNQVLSAASHIPNVDRSRTVFLHNNETGTIDYYMLALRLFGDHVQGFYWLFILLIALVVGAFLISFRGEPVFIVPCVLWLLVLLIEQHKISPTDLEIATPSNARFLPILSVLPIVFALAVSAVARPFRWLDAGTITLCALIYALCASARSYAMWQFGAVIGLIGLILLSRCLPHRWPLRQIFARYAVWPLVVFAVIATGWTAVHHARRDKTAYADATFAGHPFWFNYIGGTWDFFQSRIPEFEAESGITIDDSIDSYCEALLRIKVKERGENWEDYQIGAFFDEAKREAVAREVAFDLWRQYPLIMLDMGWHAFEPIRKTGVSALYMLAFLSIALLAIPWNWSWILAMGAGAIALVYPDPSTWFSFLGLALYAILPPARDRTMRLAASALVLAAAMVPTILLQPITGRLESGGLTDDQQFVVWLVASLFVVTAPWNVWGNALKASLVSRFART